MALLYNILITLVSWLMPLLGFFSPKLKLFVNGRNHVFETMANSISEQDDVIWFHVASLGEYEQAVPVINSIKTQHSDFKILVSFFSPSGYEVKKDSGLADVTVYLPLDTASNAKRFIKLANPKMAVFIKYDVWPNYLKELHRQHIPSILASGLYRESQIYFKWYGSFMRTALKQFDRHFVQNKSSENLLKSINIKNTTISGDTRFDRVSHQIEQDNRLDFIEEFKTQSICVVCGSTWPEDEEILVDFINKRAGSQSVKFIIAPHQIKASKIESLKNKLNTKVLCYSSKEGKNLQDYNVFIIDTIGLLTKIYNYADVAYVGGAMGNTGLHNILEPATFGVPLIIGNNFEKFPEAKKLQQLAGLYSVSDKQELKSILNKLISDTNFRRQTGQISGHFINSNTGATAVISDYIFKTLNRNRHI